MTPTHGSYQCACSERREARCAEFTATLLRITLNANRVRERSVIQRTSVVPTPTHSDHW